MKRNLILSIMGVILLVGMFSCSIPEPQWTNGAPADIAVSGKLWYGGTVLSGNIVMPTYHNWDADGTHYMGYSGSSWGESATLEIKSYRSGKVKVGDDELSYDYTITDGHMEWTAFGSVWYAFDLTDDTITQ